MSALLCRAAASFNKRFKSDSQRVAFLLCVAFSEVVCGSIGISLLTP
ncbi:DUF3265 domain-containing protein [Photobacterium iliopiscarium]|nr:DUF3265 domain-containing protein [Photobacterium iliopiscarium]PSV83505.1 DUF3265 domain-containing protein [Photobacterium iliopiscarium]